MKAYPPIIISGNKASMGCRGERRHIDVIGVNIPYRDIGQMKTNMEYPR